MSVKAQQKFQSLVVQLVKDFFQGFKSSLDKEDGELGMYLNGSFKAFEYKESAGESPTITISIPVSVLFETITTGNMFHDSVVFEASVSEDDFFTAGLYLNKGSDELLEIDKDTFEAGDVDIIEIHR